MSGVAPLELRAELLDDFFAECDEQLSQIREALARLERAAAAGAGDPAALEVLFRAVHTLKGNSAIVGLAPAEELAHAVENLLRSLTRGLTPFGPEPLDLLFQGTHRLEQLLTACRLKQATPPARDLLERLGAFGQGELPVPPPDRTAATAAPAAEAHWTAVFRPTPALDGRGININSIRTRLAALGPILSAAPVVQDGQMRFEFRLGLREAPGDPASWETDGVVFSRDDASAGPAGTAASSLFIAPSHLIRVDLSRLDELMRLTGEMVIQRSRFQGHLAATAGDTSGLHEVSLSLDRILRDLRKAITRIRLVPVAEIFARLPFVVRDLGRENSRSVRLAIEGQETEIDKYLVERLKEPLLHLVRNAVAHGIEPPAERTAAGKPPEAALTLRASTVGDAVLIEIRDDGRGIDARRLVARATAARIPIPDLLDETGLLQLICAPGISTRDQADRAAGRGVGMSVVASVVRELGGHLSLATEPGRFTQFSIRLPLTLSIAETFIVDVGPHTCAIPQGTVGEIVQVPAADVRTINRSEVVPYRGGILPVVRLRRVFGLDPVPAADLYVLVIASERGSAGLAADRVRGQRDVVVRPMRDPLLRVPGVVGATELGDGRPVLILDGPALTRGAVRPHTADRRPASRPALSAAIA